MCARHSATPTSCVCSLHFFFTTHDSGNRCSACGGFLKGSARYMCMEKRGAHNGKNTFLVRAEHKPPAVADAARARKEVQSFRHTRRTEKSNLCDHRTKTVWCSNRTRNRCSPRVREKVLVGFTLEIHPHLPSVLVYYSIWLNHFRWRT